MRRRAALVSVAVIVVMAGGPIAWAKTPLHDAAESPKYGTKAAGMLGRGVVNVATSFVDIVVGVVDGTQAGPPFVGSLVGLGQGIGCTALRAMSGGVDVATFWVPEFNGFPVSESYGDCLAGMGGGPVSRGDAWSGSEAGYSSEMAPAPRPAPAEPQKWTK